MKKLLLLSMFALLSTIATAQVNLSQSLTACYALNGNATEPINALTGTLSAVTPTVDRFNNLNSAMAFNGTNSSFIMLPDNPLLKPTNAISFSGWVKTTTTAFDQYILFTKNTGSSAFEAYELAIGAPSSPGPRKFRVRKGTGPATVYGDGTTVIVPNTWYHVAGTIDNSVINLYVNGTLEISVTSTLTFTSYHIGKKVYLGGTNESFNLPFYGSMDNVRFYNRMLNASEVNQLYLTDPTCAGDPAPIASFSASSNSVCANQNVILNDLSTSTPTAWAWQMTGGTPSISSITNPTVSYSIPGTYTISLTTTNAFGTSIPATQTVLVKPLPVVTASSANTLICTGSSAILVANGANTYTWNTSQALQAISVSPTITTTYFVIGTGSNGCENISYVTINVDNCTLLKNNDPKDIVEIYPNPTSGKLVINANEKINDIKIYDVSGKIIFKTNTTSQLDISDKPNGIYFIKFKTGEQIITRKIIKE